MIAHLTVRNYVLIESLEIDFPGGLTTITGETGAGKSIMLGAMGLILGERADREALLDKNKKCVIEGVFRIKGYKLQQLFTTHDIDYDDESIIRREILPSGKSRAFVNDSPVKLKVLKELGDKLINIHSQHETLTLNRPHFQIAVLDDFAGNSDLMTAYSKAYRDYTEKKSLLKSLKEKDKSARAEQDYYRFLFDELEKARLKEGEKEDLEKELKQLTHAEDIREALYLGAEGLLRGDVNALNLIQNIEKNLDDILAFYPEANPLSGRLKSSRIELEDIASELERMEESIDYEPTRIEYLNERLNLIYSLEQKHHVEGTDELIKLRHDFDHKLQELDKLEYELDNLEEQVVQAETIVREHATKLHAKRKKVAPQMTKAVGEVLNKLNMPEATVEIKLEKNELFNERGSSIVQILFSANKGQNVGPINKIASGGELSRLMLSIKSILSGKNILPTIVFDEIDTGVSGNAAIKMGEIMADMSKRMQVITITHLPQIAARGDQHFKVFKFEKNNRTQTDIKKLSKDERIKETALMISGENNHKEALDTAKQLIRS